MEDIYACKDSYQDQGAQSEGSARIFLQRNSALVYEIPTTMVALCQTRHNSGGPRVALNQNGGPWIKIS